MKGTHYKEKAAKARKDWNKLKEANASENDVNDKEKLRLKQLEEQLQNDMTSHQENQTNPGSTAKKKDAKLRVAHTKLSNAS